MKHTWVVVSVLWCDRYISGTNSYLSCLSFPPIFHKFFNNIMQTQHVVDISASNISISYTNLVALVQS